MRGHYRLETALSPFMLSVALLFAATPGAYASDPTTSTDLTIEASRSQLGDEADCTKEFQRPGLKKVQELVGYDRQGKPIYRDSGEAN